MKGITRRIGSCLAARERFTLCLALSIFLHGTGYAAYICATRPWEGESFQEVEIEQVDAEFLDIPPELVRFERGESNPAPVEKKEWVEGTTTDGADPDDEGDDRVSGTGTDPDGYYFSIGADRLPEPIVDFDLNQYFPREARTALIRRRTVMVMVKIDERGLLQGYEVLSEPSGLGFEEAAVKVVKRMRFRPGRKDGKAVRMLCRLPITFELTN